MFFKGLLLILGMTISLKIRLTVISVFVLLSLSSQAQNLSLIGTPEEFIIDQVSGYRHMEERALEHEEYPMLVFTDTDKELDFYFSFYRNEKICDMIRVIAPEEVLKEDLDSIRSGFTNVKDKIWENQARTVRVQLSEEAGNNKKLIMVIENIRN